MKNTLSILLLLVTGFCGFSQGWERFYGENSALTRAYDAMQLPDGDYLLLGNGGTSQGSTITRTDEWGLEKWRRSLPAGFSSVKMYPLPSGNIVLLASDRIIEIDTAANVLTTNPISPSLSAQSIIPVADGYIVTIHSSPSILRMRKIDLAGNHVWDQEVAVPAGFIPGGQGTPSPDGGFMYVGGDPPDVRLVKFDSDGNLEWTVSGGSPEIEGSNIQIIATSDNGYAVVTGWSGTANMMNRLLKFDGSGNLLWWADFSQPAEYEGMYNYVTEVIETTDGGIAIAGRLSDNIDDHPSVLKFGNTGVVDFFYVSPHPGSFNSILQTNDGGYHVAGRAVNAASGETTTRAYVVKLGSSGMIYANFLEGQVVIDEDLDCLVSAGDLPLSGWVIRATGAITSYGATDADGRFLIGVDSGAYTLEILPPNNLWSPCESAVMVNLPNIGDTVNVDFPIQIAIDCPAMQVDIGAPFLRRCFNNAIAVQYCNQGTVPAENATIEVTLDDLLELESSTIPFSEQTDNTYTFPVGDLGVGECGSFSITAYVNCNETQLGETLCMEAHAFPDTICGVSFNWSGASMMARAKCQGDSIVILELENVGTAPTSEALDFIVIEDQIIFMQDSEVFDPMEVASFHQPANGATWRITSEQEPNHPGNSIPTAFVEGCGTNEMNTFSMGFVNEHPLADGDAFFDMDCEQIIGAYDPNDKMGLPLGYGAQHYIEPNTDIEYRIRFQNTGTDTAFTVVIRDTLSPYFDPATLRPGAASHPYTFDLEGNAVAIFRFDNILLPDSNVNEALSHGFVNFRISQKTDVELGSVIENEAAIYFDFNDPVITNPVFHTVNRNFIEIQSDVTDLPEGLGELLAWPNPSSGMVTFEIPSERPVKATFVLYDQLGRLVLQKGFEGQRYLFNGSEHPKGLYFYKVEVEGLGRYSGKVILQ